MQHIYLDNAASTPIWPEVLEVMHHCLEKYHGNPSSIHFHGREARAAIEKSRKTIANLLNVSVGEIFFTSGGTEAANLCMLGSVESLGVEHIITTPIEHPCILRTAEHLANSKGISVSFVDVDHVGRVKTEALQQLIDQRKTLVSVMHANNEVGTINNISKIRSLLDDSIYFQSDTVQTVGHYRMDWTSWGIDFASASAHKFHGPKGIGFAYINERNNIIPLIKGGSQERNMRAGTENIASIVGMAKALELCHQKMADMQAKVKDLKQYAKSELTSAFDSISFHGDVDGESLYTILSCSFPAGARSDLLVQSLDIEGISVSGGSACSSGALKQSHVLAALNPDFTGTTIRLSFSPDNEKHEIDNLVQKLSIILRGSDTP